MPIDLVKFYTQFFNPFNFYKYFLQKNIDDYEEQNEDVKVRNDQGLFKYAVLMTLHEANNHYSKHSLKETPEPDEEEMEMLNNHIIDQFEDFKKEFTEDQFIATQAKKDVDFLLKYNTSEIILVK